jgi:hypothetical protein
MANDYAFKTGTATVLEGQIVPDPATLLPSGAVYVTDAAAPPTTYVTPLVLDHTASTGGLYAWDGTAYIQVAPALS